MMPSLKGQLLVAMPKMTDPRFAESVIFIVEHGEDGAMGLVVNHRLPDMSFADIIDELELGPPEDLIRLPDTVRERSVLRGGPVESGRGFVLHSTDYFRDGNSFAVTDDVGLTATLDVLRAITFGPGPQKALFALGYCGWSPGQLEEEIRDNSWLTVPHSAQLLFSVPLEERYDEALSMIGVTRASLSTHAGHA